MRERGNPNRWSAAKASEQGSKNRFPIPPLIPRATSVPPNTATSISPENESGAELSSVQKADGDKDAESQGKIGQLTRKLSQFRLTVPPSVYRLSKQWQFWAALATVGAGGVGTLAVALLLKLPAVPNCSSIYLPTASASMRLYCAELAANKQTVKDLLEAIALVKTLPDDHPLREEVNAYIKDWSQEVLNLADKSFEAGKLDEAIATARKIPADVPAYPLVESRIKQWRSVWSKAESYYRATEAEVRQENWTQAFREAIRLLYIGNKYWETTKYEELTQMIASAREDGETLTKARNLAKQGGVKNLLEAIKVAQSIPSKSYIFESSRTAIVEFGRKMIEMAEAQLDQQDVDGALAILRQIPAISNLQAEVEDYTNLAQAQSLAREGTVSSLEAAISQVKRIGSDRPLYSKTQDWIIRWQKETQDIARLDKARQLAQLGGVNDLKAAIKEAQYVPENNPRTQEAKQEIAKWQGQIQTIEDRPFLDRAEKMASLGDETSLQAAINEATQVGKGRALYQEAQSKVSQWGRQIQKIQDQPYLDQARQLASAGNFADAINVAQQIQPGRSLSNQAQSVVREWQGQIRAQQNWQQAQQLASQGTPDSLVAAIRAAREIPKSSSMRSDAENSMNQWSYQILSQAQDRANYDLPGAIAIAKSIPSGTSAYPEAKAQIEVWQNILNPPAPPTPEYTAPAPEQIATPEPQPQPQPQPLETPIPDSYYSPPVTNP